MEGILFSLIFVVVIIVLAYLISRIYSKKEKKQAPKGLLSKSINIFFGIISAGIIFIIVYLFWAMFQFSSL